MIFHYYGLIIGLSISAGFLVWEKVKNNLARDSKNSWLKKINAESFFLMMLVFALFGARIYHVIDFWDYYSSDFINILFIWNGGLAIYGAIFGGIFGIYLFSILNKLDRAKFLLLTDITAFVLPLMQVIGRWANFVNSELYGLPINPDSKFIKFIEVAGGLFYVDLNNREKGFETFRYFHPLFLYESALSLLLFVIFIMIFDRNKGKFGRGAFLSLYLIGYGCIRFMLEFLRINPAKITNIPSAQIFSIIIILAGFTFMLVNLKRSR